MKLYTRQTLPAESRYQPGASSEGITANWRDANAGSSFDAYHYRTSAGEEVDLVLEGDFGLLPVEIKHTQTVEPRKLRALQDFVRERGCRLGLVINNDTAPRLLGESILGVPFSHV